MNDVLLDIKDLRIEARAGDGAWNEIVHGVNLTLKRGEVLGLIGESGAGKSTIGLAAMGYARAGCRISGGSITFDGVDLATAPESAKRKLWGARIAYVAQSAAASFNPAYRLIDQFAEAPIRHGLSDRGKARADAIELYRRMHLPDPETIGLRYPHQVSGGQLQRAMTAMAMSCHPDLIIFDEPTTALDVTTQIEVLAAIQDAVRLTNTAAIYITHDLAVVAQLADRIKVLRHGKEVEEARTATMIEAPREDYTRSLWAPHVLKAGAMQEPAPDARPLLSIETVTAGYGKNVTVLEDISIALHKGRTMAVVGESGSGKSTLARVLTGLLPPRSGRISFDGAPLPPALGQRSRDLRRRIQMIYQMADTALNPRQTIGEIIGRPIEFYRNLDRKAVSAEVDNILDMIGLPRSYVDRLPGQLSGGQKQRIGIARALAANPEIIICDEVTSALDRMIAEEILNLLLTLKQQRGLSYLFITHDLETVKSIADDIVVMRHGRIVDSGTREEVLFQPRQPYTELLLQSVPEMRTGWLQERIGRSAKHQTIDEGHATPVENK